MRGAANTAKPLSVLVVDDNEIARCQMVEILREAGMTVFELPSAIGTTAVILRNDIRVVVLDLYMPNLDGDKVAMLFRKNERLRAVAVVLVSAAPESELAQVAMATDADAVLSKAKLENLVSVVHKARVRASSRSQPK